MLHAEVRTPRELETEVGLTEGNIFQGELTFDQLLFNRPVPGYAQYRSPIAGLWMCGSSTHPGGGVMGAPGRNAAAEILRDARKPACDDERSLCRPMTPSSSAAAPTASPPPAASPRRAAACWCSKPAPVVGGAAQTVEFAPGYRVSAVAHLLNLLDPRVEAGLDLARHGLAYSAVNLATTALSATGDHLRARRRLRRDAAAIARRRPRRLGDAARAAAALCRRAEAVQGADPAAARQGRRQRDARSSRCSA